jgi:hypothetical protein
MKRPEENVRRVQETIVEGLSDLPKKFTTLAAANLVLQYRAHPEDVDFVYSERLLLAMARAKMIEPAFSDEQTALERAYDEKVAARKQAAALRAKIEADVAQAKISKGSAFETASAAKKDEADRFQESERVRQVPNGKGGYEHE